MGNRTLKEEDKNPAAVALGRLGGKATAGALTEEERSKKMAKVVKSRWTRMSAEERREATEAMRRARDVKAKARKK